MAWHGGCQKHQHRNEVGRKGKLLVDKSATGDYLQVIDICLISFCDRAQATRINEPSLQKSPPHSVALLRGGIFNML